jgi:hypothetical protein
MKKTFQLIAAAVILGAFSSCTTMIPMQRTYPPEAELPSDSNSFVFVNFYDYQVPYFIKDRHKIAYTDAVRGYAEGLASIIRQDRRASFIVDDPLRKGFTVMSMQYPEFADTVRAICSKYGAGLLIALDSLELRIDSEFYITDNGEGSGMMAKDFYLYVNSYVTLYTSDGAVIDRCAGELSDYIKSKYTVFGMFGGPTLARISDRVAVLAAGTAKDCIGKFYPFTDHYTEKLYTGGPFNQLNQSIFQGYPEKAVEPLRKLSLSYSTSLSKKASWNLKVVNEILENRKSSDEIWNRFSGTDH